MIARALELGFARAAVTTALEPERYAAYEAWLDAGRHGEMAYMARDDHRDARKSLARVLPGARSAVVVLAHYGPGADGHRPPSPDAPGAGHGHRPPSPGVPGAGHGATGRVARYAHGADYHRLMKRALATLGEELVELAGGEVRACVDTAPVLERDLARRAGLGFIGKNTMLITPGLGSYTHIGALLTTAELAPSEVTENGAERDTDRCGGCTACLDVCPTRAFDAPRVLDARRCISYLTIEHRAPIPDHLRPLMGDMIFGCDLCQDACPYNRAAPHRHPAFPELGGEGSPRQAPRLADLLTLRRGGYRRLTAGSAMNRARPAMLRRNAAIAAGNLPRNVDAGTEAALDEALDSAVGDPDELVSTAAAWATRQRGLER